MFRRREILHIGTDFGNDSDGSKSTADTRSGLKNGKLLLIGGGERKNEFLKLCLPGFKVFIMSLDYLEFTSLFGCDMAVNGITQFKKFLFQAFENKGFKVKGSICGIFQKFIQYDLADLPKVSETTEANWILETVRQFCKRFFSLDLKQVSLKR